MAMKRSPLRYLHAYCGPCNMYLEYATEKPARVGNIVCPKCGLAWDVWHRTTYPLLGKFRAVNAIEKPKKKRGR